MRERKEESKGHKIGKRETEGDKKERPGWEKGRWNPGKCLHTFRDCAQVRSEPALG